MYLLLNLVIAQAEVSLVVVNNLGYGHLDREAEISPVNQRNITLTSTLCLCVSASKLSPDYEGTTVSWVARMIIRTIVLTYCERIRGLGR